MTPDWFHNLVEAADRHEGLAAWVQAIGTILAIIAAWGISTLSSRSERDRENRGFHRRARAIAISIYPNLVSVKAHVKNVRHYAENSDFGLKENLNMFHVQSKLIVPVELTTDTPADLWALPPDAAKAFSQTNYYLWQYNDFISGQIPGLSALNPEQQPIYRHRADSYLRALESISTEAVEIFSALHES